MKKIRTTLLACALIGAFSLAPSVHAQAFRTQSGAQPVADLSSENAAEKEALAESIVARQEAAGKQLDRAFRAHVTSDLASRPLEELLAIQKGAGLVPGPQVLGGSSAADLVYTPVAPCRIIDTRVVGGPIAAGAQRSFYAAVNNYSTQGGSATTCGIPFGPATAVVVNVVAVNPAAAGDLRAFAFGGTLPTASIINYAKVNDVTSGGLLNIANAFTLKICDPAVVTCPTSDFTIQADTSATQVVMDVLGFYRKVDSTMTDSVFSPVGIVAGNNFFFPAATYTPPQNQKCTVAETWSAFLSAPYTTGTSYTQVAIETAGTPAALSTGAYVFHDAVGTGGSANAVVSVTAGTAYRFGCFLSAAGDLVNAATTNYCHVSFHCQ